MSMLVSATRAVTVHRVAPGAYLALLPGPSGRAGSRLRLVGGDHVPYAERATRAIDAAVRADDGAHDGPARVLLAGWAQGGPTALDIAAASGSSGSSASFRVERVLTAGAPAALVPRVPREVRVISLEDRDDPVALLGSLVNAATDHRVTVVFDSAGAEGEDRYLVGARATDSSDHPDLRAALDDLRELGYLA